MKIALDVMGGDFAPQAIVDGALLAAPQLPTDAEIVLIGRAETVEEHLAGRTAEGARLTLHPADDVIRMGEHPTKAFSQKPRSSIAVGFGLLKAGAVDAFCSAGNTGAMRVGALFTVKAIAGVLRPAIAGYLPKEDGSQGVILDVGANADVKAEALAQFGLMGSLYAEHVLGIERPRVGLINIGEEAEKGTILAQTVYQQLQQNPRVHFVGNVEGRDLFMDRADVVVCDGFTGNVVLKMAERFYDSLHQHGVFGLSDGPELNFFRRFNYEQIGGSPIIGVNGNVIIGHGISSPRAIQNMCLQAHRMAEVNLHQKIKRALHG
ncbi:MAG: phosphate acyltransferase PlsX [Catalinimonas sp.]